MANIQTMASIPKEGGAISFSYKTNGSCKPSTAAITWLPKIEYQDGVSGSSYNHFDVQYKEDISHGNYVQISCDATSEGDETLYEVLLIPTINSIECNGIKVSQANRDCDCSGLWYFTSHIIDMMGCDPYTPIATFDFVGCDVSKLSFQLSGGPSVHVENGNTVVVDDSIPPCPSYLPYIDFPLTAYYDGNECKTIMVRQEGKVPCSCQNRLNYSFHSITRRFSSAGTYNSSTHDYDEIMVASGSSPCGIIQAKDSVGSLIVEGSLHTVNDGNDFYVYAKIKESPNPSSTQTNTITYRFQKNGGTEIDTDCMFYSEIEEIPNDKGCQKCGSLSNIFKLSYVYDPIPYNNSVITLPWRAPDGVLRGYVNSSIIRPIFNYKGYVAASQVPWTQKYTYDSSTREHFETCYGFDTVDEDIQDVMMLNEVSDVSVEYSEVKLTPIYVAENLSSTPKEFDVKVGIYTDHYYSYDKNTNNTNKEAYTKGKLCSATTIHITQSGAPNPTCDELFTPWIRIGGNTMRIDGQGFHSNIFSSGCTLGTNAEGTTNVSCFDINTSEKNYTLSLAGGSRNNGHLPYDYFNEDDGSDPFARWSFEKLTSSWTYNGVTYPKTADWVINIGALEEVLYSISTYSSQTNDEQYTNKRGDFIITIAPFSGNSSCSTCPGASLPSSVIESRCTVIKLKYDDHDETVCEKPIILRQFTYETPPPPEPPTDYCGLYSTVVSTHMLVPQSGGTWSSSTNKYVGYIEYSYNVFSVTITDYDSDVMSRPKFVKNYDSNMAFAATNFKPNNGAPRTGTFRFTYYVVDNYGIEHLCEDSIQYEQAGVPGCYYEGGVTMSVNTSYIDMTTGSSTSIILTINSQSYAKDDCYDVFVSSQQPSHIEATINGSSSATTSSGGTINITVTNNATIGNIYNVDISLKRRGETQERATATIIIKVI